MTINGSVSPSGAEAHRARLLVVEDHPLFCEALVAVVAEACPGADVLKATSVDEAQHVLANGPADLVLLDLSTPGTTGLLGLMRIRRTSPRASIVVVSAFDEVDIVAAALSVGAAGYIAKSTPRRELAAAIREVLGGGVCAPSRHREALAAWRAGPEMLSLTKRLSQFTAQQLRVLDMICRGFQNKHVAHELDICVTTVKVHVSEILRKLEVRSRTEAIIELARLDFATLRARAA